MTSTTIGTSVAAIAPELSSDNGQITTTSIQVAQHFGKEHRSVLLAIRRLECSSEFTLHNFVQCSRPGSNNKPEPYVRMTRDGFTFLAMGFTGKEAAQWKEAYIKAFNAMEAQLTQQALRGENANGEPVFRVTALELDTLVEQRVQQHWLGPVALASLPRKRLQAERDAYNALLTDAGQLALAADMFMKASQNMAAHAVLAGEVLGGVRTLHARAHTERDRVDSDMNRLVVSTSLGMAA